MESSPPPSPAAPVTPTASGDADDADGATGEPARSPGRPAVPWWYHVGFGVAIALGFISVSLRIPSFGVPAMSLGVLALSMVLKQTTGIADPYTPTPSARRLTYIWALISLVVAVAGGYLEWGADVGLAFAVAGALIGAYKIIIGFRIADAVQRDLRADRERAAL